MKKALVWISESIVVVLLAGCGKYAAPQPPERLSPAPVEVREVVATGDGVTIQWLAPTMDRQGKRLKELLGYVVYRKEMLRAGDAGDPPRSFEEIQRVDDTSLARLSKKAEEAAQAGKPVRRVSLASEERRVSMTDRAVVPGRTYLYKIVPFSAEGGEGSYDSLVQVVFFGSSGSAVTVIPAAKNESLEDASVNANEDQTPVDGIW